MTVAEFEASLHEAAPPAELSPLLQALWHERRGDWARAHAIAQDIPGRDAAWVHAYLHRREGDLGNAAYWYRHARRDVDEGDMDAEWADIARTLLAREENA